MVLPRRGVEGVGNIAWTKHMCLCINERSKIYFMSSGVGPNSKRSTQPKARVISLRPKSAKQLRREHEYKDTKKIKYTRRWFDQFAVHLPKYASALDRTNKGTQYVPKTKIFNVPPPPYESSFSGRPMPFRPKFCGGKTIDKNNPHNKAKQMIAEKNKEKTNAPIYENKQIVLKKPANEQDLPLP